MIYSKEQIVNLQVALIAMKSYAGRPDGIPGPLTIAGMEAVLREFKNPTTVPVPPVVTPEPGLVVVKEPTFVRVPGVKYKTGSYVGGTPSGLVVHYTVSGNTAASADSIVKYLAKQGYGCMVMDRDGKIYIPEGFDIFKHSAAHAGASKWNGMTSMNSRFMGMEICNWGSDGAKHVGAEELRTVKSKNANQYPGTYQKYTAAQEASLVNFCLWAKGKCPTFKFENVAGHDEVATPAGRKNDPGGSLSMTMPAFRQHLDNLWQTK